jgi:hypothetical protein
VLSPDPMRSLHTNEGGLKLVAPFLKRNMVLVTGSHKRIGELNRHGNTEYSLTYNGDMSKRGLVLLDDKEALEKLGFKVEAHWKFPDDPLVKCAYGIKCTVHDRHDFNFTTVDAEVKNFLRYSSNEDFTNFLNTEDAFGNG